MQLPEDFINAIQPLLGKEWTAFADALTQIPPVSIRINPSKPVESLPQEASVLWSDTGYYLDKRPSFTFDPFFHAGTYYVQEASSMFIEQVFRQYVQGEVNVLDLCAAPGGKSTHIASLISRNSLLVSNEVIRSRAHILSENMTKAGYSNTIVTNSDPADIGKLTGMFDVILVDAPCSGEGMFRKDPQALNEWSLANVQLCKERQQRIVADVWNSLKPGGILIYSTCTYNRSENEDNVIWIRDNLDAEALPLEINDGWGISPSYDKDLNVYHFFPHKTQGEGFFIAALRKNGEGEAFIPALFGKGKKDKKQKAKELSQEFKDYLINPEEYIFFDKGESWFAFPKKHHEAFQKVISAGKLVSAGIYLGEVKGKDFIPQHSLAMSIDLNKEAFECYEVDKETAIQYLRKEAMSFPGLKKGYVLLTYKNIPLGFIKNIGNRANNLYPNEWRIRSTYSSSLNK